MRIRTEGNDSRKRTIRNVSNLWDRNKTDSLLLSAKFAIDMLGHPDFRQSEQGNLEKALNHPDMTAELAEVLTGRYVTLSYETQTELQIDE